MNTDTVERIKIGFKFIFQSYKVMMGSLLTLFVPQECYIDNQMQVCSLQNNIEKNDIVNKIALGFNFLSVFLFIGCYIIELKRENFLIKHLDIDHNHPDNNLDLILNQKPKFANQLQKYNNYYFSYVKILASFYMFNLIISSVSIYDHYAGISTITSYMSYTTLILLKLYDSTYISYCSSKNNRALSSYMLEFSSFNVFDKDFLEEKDEDENIDPEKIKLELEEEN